MDGHEENIESIAYGTNDWIYSAATNGKLKQWLKEKNFLKRKENQTAIGFFQDQQSILSFDDTSINIWNVQGEDISNYPFENGINYAELGPKENIYIELFDSSLIAIDPNQSGKVIWNSVEGSHPFNKIFYFKFSPDKRMLFTLFSDKYFRLMESK